MPPRTARKRGICLPGPLGREEYASLVLGWDTLPGTRLGYPPWYTPPYTTLGIPTSPHATAHCSAVVQCWQCGGDRALGSNRRLIIEIETSVRLWSSFL